jgi:3-oxoacyl-[acyl-carrier-protein] synthase-3
MLHSFDGLQISDVAAVVPSNSEGAADCQAVFREGWNAQLIEQTGIRSLRKSRLSTLELGLAACRALYPADEQPDAIISVTQTPARQLPGNASGIAAGRGWQGSASQAPLCWDLQMGCAGLVWGLYQAAMLLQQPGIKEVLLVCAETHSRLLNPSDRATRLLFGDGASAMRIVKKAGTAPWYISLGSQPDAGQQLCTTPDGQLHMDGLGIFNFTVGIVAPALEAFLHQTGTTKSDVSCFLMHQASGFVLKYLQRMLQIPADKMPMALDGYGNTGSASLGILLSHCFPGEVHPELQRAMLVGFGSGFQWGFHLADLSQTRIHPVHELHPDGRLVPLAGKGI